MVRLVFSVFFGGILEYFDGLEKPMTNTPLGKFQLGSNF